MTEEGAQRVPPRGVRSYMASNCAPICARVSSGLARLTPATSVTSRSLLNFRLAGCSKAGSARPSATKRLTARFNLSTLQRGRGGPFGSIALGVEHAHDVLPAMIGAHFFDDRQPMFGGSVDALEIGLGFRVGNVLDGVAIAGAQFGIAADAAAFFGGAQPVLGAFLNQRALEFRDGAEHLQCEATLRRRGVDRIGERFEMRALGVELGDDRKEMRQASAPAGRAWPPPARRRAAPAPRPWPAPAATPWRPTYAREKSRRSRRPSAHRPGRRSPGPRWKRGHSRSAVL